MSISIQGSINTNKHITMYKLVQVVIILFGYQIMVTGQEIIAPRSISTAEIKNLYDVNTTEFEFSPTFYRDGIAFVYSKKKKKKFFDKKTNSSFFDIGFYFPQNSAFPYDSTRNMEHFDLELNSEYHEGPLCFFQDNECFYTREDTDYSNAKKRKNKQTILQIYYSKNTANHWSESILMPFCDKDYNYCHPTISSDGKTMIFASDKPGGYGKMDLYLITKEGKEWSEPYNLGANINGTKNDWFPFLFRDDLLFFASEKNNGLGGLDIYVSKFENNQWSEIELLPEPINGPLDDFGLIMKDDAQIGFLTSSRPGGRGNDDIYSFKTASSIIFADNYVNFMYTAMDSINDVPISEVEMNYIAIKTKDRVFDIKNYDLNLLKAKNKGDYLLELSPNSESLDPLFKTNLYGKVWGSLDNNTPYIISFSKPGYKDYNLLFDPKKTPKEQTILMVQDPNYVSTSIPETIPVKKEIVISTISGSIMTFNNIYYDSNKHNIKPGAAEELDALANVMLNNATMKIVLNAYTDSKGKTSYNLILSQKRADAAKQYLQNRGVESDRIIAIGMGESKLINHCENGVKCSEAEHRINRRTEVKVL